MDESQTKNKTPVVHVDNHLGLESWCCPIVYRHAHQIILTASKKQPHHHTIGMGHSESNGSSGSSSSSGGADHIQPFNHTLVKYLNCAILINPDVSTFWNARRRLVQKDRLDIRREFKFSSIVLSKKPKSNDAFCYRRWLYSFQSHESIDWTRELSLCERCASKSLSNYQAWAHRQWVLQKAPFLLQYELQTTERFIRKHIGDYSGYYHRQFVLHKMNELRYFEHEPNNDYNLMQYAALIEYLAGLGCAAAQQLRVQLPTMDSTNQQQQQQHSPPSSPQHPNGNGNCGNGGDNGHQTAAWQILLQIITPQRDCDADIDPDVIGIKSFLYCMNVAAYDLKFTDELKEMFGYREAFECHRRAIVRFMADKCREWSVIPLIANDVSIALQNVTRSHQFK